MSEVLIPDPTTEPGAVARVSGGLAGTLRRLVRTPGGAIGMAIVGVLVLAAILAPLLAPFDPVAQRVGERLSQPGADTILGTDHFGRDILSRLIHGSRISLSIGFGAVAVGGAIGTLAGLVTGYFGGWADSVLGRLWDVLFAFPGILLGLIVVAIFGPSIRSVAIGVAIVNVPIFARVSRASVLRERELEYVDSSRVLGMSHWRIMVIDILPNTMGPLLVQFTISVGFAVLFEAALSFLGLGTQPPDPSWGTMINESRRFLRQAPWFGVFPGVALAALLVGLNLLADAVREVLDPRRAGSA